MPETLPGGRLGTPGVPQTIRWTEDWSDPRSTKASPLEALRHLPIGSGSAYLSLGGEIRLYQTSWSHMSLGNHPDDRNAPLQSRIRLVSELQVSPRLRAFVELGDNHEVGENRPTPPNRNKLDVQQAFVDLGLAIGSASVTIRPGRFEMPLGNGKLFGIREGLNSRMTYQGVRGTFIQPGRLSVDIFDVRPTLLRPNTFNDGADHGRRLRGVYAGTPPSLLVRGTALDLYAYVASRDRLVLLRTAGRDHRLAVGARLWGRGPTWDYDVEGVVQRGMAADKRIAAWAVLAEAGVRWSASPRAARIGVRSNVFSGDHASHPGSQRTFVAEAPRNPLYSEAAFLAFANLIDLYPMLNLSPAPTVKVTAGPDWFWRQSTGDAVYLAQGGRFAPTPTGGRFVGTALNLEASWALTPRLSLQLFETAFLRSDSFQRMGARSSNYFGFYGRALF